MRGDGGEVVEKDIARVRVVEVERRGEEGVEGGSPKTKNLMKAPIRRTMLSWPRMKPWAKERERLRGRNG